MTPNTTYYPAQIDIPEELVKIKATLKATAKQVRVQYIRRGKLTSGNVAVSKLVISRTYATGTGDRSILVHMYCMTYATDRT